MSMARRIIGLGLTVGFLGACPGKVDSLTGRPELVVTSRGVVVRSSERADLDFGTVVMGQSEKQTILIHNTGTGPLRLQSVVDLAGGPIAVGSGDGTAVFVIKLDDEVVIEPAGERELEVVFQPPLVDEVQKAYEASAVLRFSGTSSDEVSPVIHLVGNSVSAGCAVPAELDFGEVELNDTSTLALPFRNRGPSDVRASVSAISGDARAFFRRAGPAQFTVPGNGGERLVEFEFRPTELRAYRGLVKVRRAASCPEGTLALVGQGVETVLSWSPASLDFGFATPKGVKTAELVFANSGMKPVVLSNLRLLEGVQPATRFRVEQADPGNLTSLTVPGATRANGQTVPGTATVKVSFRPQVTGRSDGWLRAETNALSQPRLLISMTGIGGGPNLTVSPDPVVNLGRVAFFPTARPPLSALRWVVVSNTGSRSGPLDPPAHLRLGKAGSTLKWEVAGRNGTAAEELCIGDHEASSGRCLDTLGAYPDGGIDVGSEFALGIPFRVIPRSLGLKEWAVTIHSNDPDEPEHLLTVKANAVALPPCRAEVYPDNLNFGVVTSPLDKTLAFSIRNMGTTASEVCLISGVAVEPSSDPMYSIVGGDTEEALIGPGEQLEVRVKAWQRSPQPGSRAGVAGRVTFNISNPERPERHVSLLATDGQGCLTIWPQELNFGNVKKGCSSADRTVHYFNNCAAEITIAQVSMAQVGGLPAMSPGCPEGQRCAEFFASDLSLSSGPIAAAGHPRTARLRYRPLDFGSDTGALLIRVTNDGGFTEDHVLPLRGRGESNGTVSDVFEQRAKTDILLVIDTSESMCDTQTRFADNSAAFLKHALAEKIDFRVAATAAELDGSSGWGWSRLSTDGGNARVLLRSRRHG